MNEPGPSVATPVHHTFGVKLHPLPAWGIAAIVASLSIADSIRCGPNGPEVTPEPTYSVTQTVVLPTASPRSNEERGQELMWALFNLNTGDFFDALNPLVVRAAGDLGYKGLIAPVIEVSRFAFTNEAVEAVESALQRLTGENFAGDDFNSWYAWLGRHQDLPVAPGYDEWKGQLYTPLDFRFTKFFYKGVPARVPLWGAVWGGVRVDGIPPLNDPKFIPAEEASYLLDDDVVLGVGVNGDIRAYPHRILAWHELSNDVVGGRPVTLVY